MVRIMYLSVILVIAMFNLNAQADIERAIAQENLESLVSFFDSSIETFVLDDEASGVERSKRLLGQFFAAHEVNSFRKRHSGSSPGGSSNYAIGQLVTDKGSYRVSIYYFSDDRGYHITELSIE